MGGYNIAGEDLKKKFVHGNNCKVCDLLAFVNSEDIKEYLMKLDYECSSLEAAWLVYQCNTATMKEKQGAWSWIIKNMPDCEMPARQNCIYRKSLHKFLEGYMNFVKKHELQICADMEMTELSIEEQNLWLYSFDGLWFDFPTPFTKGDIVIDSVKTNNSHQFFQGGAFVLDSISNGLNANEEIKHNGDITDMTACGYFMNKDGCIYYEVMYNYMDLELYHKPLIGMEHLLTAIGNYLKGKLDIALLLNSQYTLMRREMGVEQHPEYYTEDGLRLAGLIEEEFE